MINIDLPDNRSVIVFSSFRTSSTALCDWISQTKGLTNFDEAFLYADRAIGFVNFVNKTPDKFVVKVMCNTDQYTPRTREYLQSLLDRCTVLRLSRRNVFAQITSFYIAAISSRWHYVKIPSYWHPAWTFDQFCSDIPIDQTELKKSAISILNANKRLYDLPMRVDQDLISEDLGVLPSNYQMIPPPANQDQLNTALQTLIDSDLEVGILYRNRQDFCQFGK